MSFVATGLNERTAVEAHLEPRGVIKGLPVVGIYGKNASGKSDVLRALQDMARAVRFARLNRHGIRVDESEQLVPFLFDDRHRNQPTMFEVELLLHGVRYVYGLEFGNRRVQAEWLHAYPNGRRQVWFERKGPEETDFRFPGDHLKGPKMALVELVRPDTLLLGLVLGVVKHPQLEPVADWFGNAVMTAGSGLGDPGFPRRFVGRNLARFLAGHYGDQARQLLVQADLGISGAEVVEREVGDRIEQVVRLRHACTAGDYALPLSEESEGTVSWLSALRKILPILDRGGLLLYDELTANLHPQLAAEVIRMFQDPSVNAGAAQLIFTSHDVTTLASAFGAPLLDRDQVWFTEKAMMEPRICIH